VALLETEIPIGAIAPMLEALELYVVGSALHERRCAGPDDGPDPDSTPRLAEAVKRRALGSDEIFDLVCGKIIDTVVEAAAQDQPMPSQSMPSGSAGR
jgi:TetR/AcrR family tetracycline transcriptional repressor